MKTTHSITKVCISFICLFLLPGCKKLENTIESQTKLDVTSNSTNDTVITPPAPSKLWSLYEEIDELTGKKTEYLGYTAKVNIRDYPNANIESKIYCENYSESMQKKFLQIAKVTGSYPREIITVYDAPSLKTENITIFNQTITVLKSRGVGLDDSQHEVVYRQGDFSNVFMQSFSMGYVSNIFFDIIKNGDIDKFSIASKLKDSLVKEFPKRVEIKFSNGLAHIINYDDSFQNFAKKCIENLKVGELELTKEIN